MAYLESIDPNLKFQKTPKHKWTALHLASKYSDVEVVKYLVNLGLNVSAVWIRGKTPYFEAVKQSKVDTLKYFDEIDSEVRFIKDNGKDGKI